MSTRELIDAIRAGDSVGIQAAFEDVMASRIVDRLDAMRQDVAKNMFSEAAGDASKVGANHLHVQQVKHEGQTKYRVHAVGKNFADGIKAGEHLSDTELDDFQEMGGKIKHVKEEAEVVEENQYMWKIEGGSGKGKEFGAKSATVDDHLSAMKYHSSEYQNAMKEKRDADARHHGMKYHKHKDQIERLGSAGDYRKEEVEVVEEEQLDELSKDTVKRYATRAGEDRADLKDMRKEIKRDIKDDPENADMHKDTLKRADQYIKRRETGLARAKSRM